MTRFALCLIPIVLLGSCDDFTAPQRVSLKADIERTPTGIHYSYVVVNATEEAIFLPTCGGVAPLSFHTLLDGFELDGMATICPADQTMVPLEVPAGTTHQDSGYYGGVSDAYLRPYLMYAESMTGAASSSVSDRTVYVP
ncbi:MAG TPA: hypothetical protein VFM71_00895 [Gemmatimonadaceae bacterium]|nr:hypothetical protein [Gemmatimonadaceae bacterium]